MSDRLDRISIASDASIRDVMATIDRGAIGIAVVLDNESKLVGTITDGDIRRAILSGRELDCPVSQVIEDRAASGYQGPVTASKSAVTAELVRQMRTHGVRHLVLVDDSGCADDLVTLEQLLPYASAAVEAVIMAGGRGRRLMPLTDALPKPMLPVGGRPMLEWIIDGLKRAGISKITITSHYKAEIIRRYFGNGWKMGVEITHLYEQEPRGTAGALQLLAPWQQPILVINGDILTWVDFTSMLKFHAEQRAELTVAVRKHNVEVPYGVVDLEGAEIRRLSEKPKMPYFVNAGIYLLQPSVREHLGKDEYLDMTDLIDRLIARGQSGRWFPGDGVLGGHWQDRRLRTRAGTGRAPAAGGGDVNVLITGGAGYIGSAVCRRLLAHGHAVRVLDSLNFGGESLSGFFLEDGFEFHRGDICSAETVRRSLKGIDAVVHLAAIVGDPACARQPDQARQVNQHASVRLFEECVRSGVSQFVFASTCSNYGRLENGLQTDRRRG